MNEEIKLAKKTLKIAGVTKTVLGVTLLFATPYYGALLLLIGVFLLFQSYKDDVTIYNNKVIYMILSIAGIADVVGSMMFFINYDRFVPSGKGANAPPKKYVRSIDDESKKIEILLLLGVLMVFLSGLIFATTSWSMITDLFKVVALFCFGLLFLCISIFSERKLKLYRSSFLYWFLGIAFFLFTIIALIYFNIFGDNVSFTYTSNLAYGIVLLSLSGFLIVSHFKYPDKHLFLVGLLSLLFSVYLLLKHFIPYEFVIVGILSFIILLINIFNKNKNDEMNKYFILFSYIMVGLNIGYFLDVSSTINPFVILLLGFIQIVSINHLIIKYDDKDTNLLIIILTYVLFGFSFGVNTYIYDNYPIIFMLFISLYTFLLTIKLIDCDNLTYTWNYYLYSFFGAVVFLNSYETYSCIGISFVYLMMNFIFTHNIFKVEKLEFLNYIETIALELFIISILSVFDIEHKLLIAFAITSIVYCILYFIYLRYSNNKHMNMLYPISIAITSGIVLLCNYDNILWLYLVSIFSSLYLFVIHYTDIDESNKVINYTIIYILLLSSICYPFVIQNILDLNIMIVTIFYIVILLLLIPILNNKYITRFTLLYISLPLINLVQNGFDSEVLEAIFENLIGFYVLFLVLYLFVKGDDTRTVFALIGLGLLMLRIVFIEDILVFLYVGMIGLIYIVIGFRYKGLSKLFIGGVIVVLLDIIKGLWDVWSQIPSWLYLLVVGLSIISFVMYREVKKQKK